jgi:hypothetical protein
MAEWWTYSLEDFLLFSPRVYRRMIELHNEAVWPLPVPALIVGAAILYGIVRRRPWSDRTAAAALAALWAWVAWSFLYQRYATINWAAVHAAGAFAMQALLLLWLGVLRNDLRVAAGPAVARGVGIALLLYALVLHPFAGMLAGNSPRGAELFGIAPDPTAIFTLGYGVMLQRGPASLLVMIVPAAWCVVAWATLRAMDAPESWVPAAALAAALIARFGPWGRSGGRR